MLGIRDEMAMTVLLLLLIGTATLVNCHPRLPLSPHTPRRQHLDTHLQETPDQLLKQVFGISSPGVRGWASEPPQYMLDLYTQVADSSGLTRLPGPYGATVVRAFSEKDGSSETRFTFLVSGFKDEEEEVLEAEFHLHHSRLPKVQRHLLQEDNTYLMEVRSVRKGENEHQILVKEYVAAHSSGWRVFRVGPAVREVLITSIEEEHRVVLEVSAKTLEGRSLPLSFHHGDQGSRRPLLVVFSSPVATNDTQVIQHHYTDTKQISESPAMNRVRRSVSNPGYTDPWPNHSEMPSGCERRDMYVDFESIGWASWIVYPKGYNAYRCTGRCTFPLGQNLNPTNHATVQSILHHSGDHPGVHRPCCVPSMYANLSLLYYDAEENVVLKQYDQMVALLCGCH